MTPAAFLTAFAEAVANDGGLILLVLFILWLGARKRWVWGYQLERLETQLTDERVKAIQEIHDIRAERDQWRAAYLFTIGHPSFQGKAPPQVPQPPVQPGGAGPPTEGD